MAYSSYAVAKITCGVGARNAFSTSKPSIPGIWTSRKTRSGRSFSIIARASTPSRAWPISSTLSTFARNPARRSRASFSSSTTSVRIAFIGRSRLGGLLEGPRRQAQADARAGAWGARDLGEVRGTVEPLEARLQVAEADAALV